MKKKLAGAWLCTIIMATALFGCALSTKTGNDPVNTPDEEPEQTNTTVSNETVPDQEEPDDTVAGGRKIAISMPAQSVQRWVSDSEKMKQELEAKGYEVDIQFAEDDPKQQAAQMESFVQEKADCIIVVPIDSKELTAAAEEAKKAEIPVIAYDRLLMDTDAIYYYATFDHKGVGRMIGQKIERQAGLEDLSNGAYKTIEFFMGDQEDSDSNLIYQGLMEVLQPYLDDGRLICKSGRTSFEDTSISEWSQETAREWCKNYLAGYYTDEELDIWRRCRQPDILTITGL